MSPILRLRLLGAFSLTYHGAAVLTVTGARLQSLLAYLVIHRDAPQSRQHLAYLFWPDATEEQARNNLRQLWHQLRHALPDADRVLYADASAVGWRSDAPFGLDVADVTQALARADAADRCNDQVALRRALEEAVDLYQADLLPSCYDEWIVPERERLRQRHLDALALLLRILEAQRDYGTAIRYARRWTHDDPLAEDAYRALMRLLALADDRAGALQVFRTCADILTRELGVAPSPATRAVHDRLVRLDAQQRPTGQRRRPRAGLPGFVGRQQEWIRLQTAWQSAATVGPTFVLVTGEAGIGKSRLAEELLTWAARQGIVVARTRSYAAEGQLSLAPVTDWLRSSAFRPHLTQLASLWLSEVSRILPELLAEWPALPRPEPLTEYGQRQRFFEALARALLIAPQPLLVLLDDLQWCDQETLEWLHFLLRFDAAARMLVIGTARAEELPAHHALHTLLLHLRATGGLHELALHPLDADETARLAAQVGGRPLEDDAALHLYRETDGVPLFVVETVRAGITHAPDATQAGAPVDTRDASDWPAVPPRVHAVIAGRLAQLSAPARDLAGVAAAVGRSFTLDLLLGVSGNDEASTVRALDELWTKRIIRDQGMNGYDFAHDKLREVAYAQIGAPQRRLLHRRIAQALASAHAEDLDAVSGQIASHYEHASMAEQAIPHYQRAAAVEQRVYANDDAISLLSRGLMLLEHLPASTRRDAQELGLLLALAPLFHVAKGWAAPEAEQVLDRALALCDKVGDDGQRAQVLLGLQHQYVVQARLAHVQHIGDELATLYQRMLGTAPPLLTEVYVTAARFHRGYVVEASTRFAEISTVHDPDQLQRLQEAHGVNYMVHTLAWHAHALWCLGYPEAALRRGRDAVQLARDLAQPFNQVLAAAYLALLVQLCADTATTGAQGGDALALARDYRAPYYCAWATILVSYAQAGEQPTTEHIAALRRAIAAFTASGARLRLPYYLSLLARVCGHAGRAHDGLAVVDEALAAARAHNERWWDAELHRIRGELLLADGAEEREVEAALVRAVEIARFQQARSLELRAAAPLARLWAAQHRVHEGRLLLHDLCAWFTEGHASTDMIAARELLEQLGT